MLYILELCSVGSLSEFLHSRPLPTLLESELRGVTKSLVDALTYLKKELVVHRNINLCSVLLTGDLGVVSQLCLHLPRSFYSINLFLAEIIQF